MEEGNYFCFKGERCKRDRRTTRIKGRKREVTDTFQRAFSTVNIQTHYEETGLRVCTGHIQIR